MGMAMNIVKVFLYIIFGPFQIRYALIEIEF